jgi:hypothetical protein
MGLLGDHTATKWEPLSNSSQPQGGSAFEGTDRLNRTFHLRDAGDGRSGCMQPPQKLIKACCRKEGAHSCSWLPPRGCPGLSDGNPAAFAGACGKTQHRCTVQPSPWSTAGRGKINPSVVLKRRAGNQSAQKCKDHPPDACLPFGNK